MEELWKRIEMWLRQHAPHILDSLNAGASEDEIKALQMRFGAALPKELVDFYRVHNGQPENSSGLFYGLQFLPIADVLMNHESWSELVDMNEEFEENMESYPDGVIKKLYANPGWLPVTHDYGGNHIGVDLDPDWKGVPGQVIIFGRDEDCKRFVAESFPAFIEFFVTQLEEGNYYFKEDQLCIKHFPDGQPLDPQLSHFHNVFAPVE
jgi:cell wall assembly regulator SMI1